MRIINSPTCPSIHVTSEDKIRLQKVIQSLKSERMSCDDCSALELELKRAIVIESRHVPRNIVTMHSRVGLIDLDTSERMVFTLVYPEESNVEDGRISVVAPLGSAMLGCHTGDEFEWGAPTGSRRFIVEKVMYQPESKKRRRVKNRP
ncbi:GreA/GreB family elongation factor [Pelagicoccus sp. SDUM812002]|uniref:GreA/GreB family elongation factor n=1 Tax=Pelagicoccus sp. SDUM812002 TaxID=3041266 RepID=UPI0034E299CC